MGKKVIHGVLVAVLAILSSFFMTSAGWSATYYVDATNGKDSNQGTSEATAWKTIGKVNSSRFKTGDQILFKRGELWRGQIIIPSSGTYGNPIIFSAYGSGDKPKILGSIPRNQASEWTFEAESNKWFTLVSSRPSAIWRDDIRMVEVKNSSDIDQPMKWSYDSNRSRVYTSSVDNPSSGHTIEVASIATGVDTSAKEYLTIDNLDIRYYGQQGVHLYVDTGTLHGISIQNCIIVTGGTGVYQSANTGQYDGVTIRDNTISPNYKLAAYYGEQTHYGVLLWKNSKNFLIMGNTISGASKDGVQVEDCSNGVISNNILGENQENSVDIKNSNNILISANTCRDDQQYAVVIHDDEARNAPSNLTYDIIVESNYIYGSGKDGVNDAGIFLHYVDNTIVRYNWIDSTYGNGIVINDAESHDNDNYVYYNLITNCGTGKSYQAAISLDDCTGTKIYNNTIYNQQRGGDGINVVGGPNTQNISIINNLILSVARYSVRILSSGVRGFVSDTNCFFPDGPDKLSWEGSGCNFGDWKAQSRQDGNSIATDPQLGYPLNNDFTLNSNSPCINIGTIVGLTRDSTGTPLPLGSGVDIGAFQHKKGGVPPRNLRLAPQ